MFICFCVSTCEIFVLGKGGSTNVFSHMWILTSNLEICVECFRSEETREEALAWSMSSGRETAEMTVMKADRVGFTVWQI